MPELAIPSVKYFFVSIAAEKGNFLYFGYLIMHGQIAIKEK